MSVTHEQPPRRHYMTLLWSAVHASFAAQIDVMSARPDGDDKLRSLGIVGSRASASECFI